MSGRVALPHGYRRAGARLVAPDGWGRRARIARLRELFPWAVVGDTAVLLPEVLVRADPLLEWAKPYVLGNTLASIEVNGSHIPAVRVPAHVWDDYADDEVALLCADAALECLLPSEVVADAYGITPATLRAYVSRGHIGPPARTIGGTWMWSRSQIVAAAAGRKGQGKRDSRR